MAGAPERVHGTAIALLAAGGGLRAALIRGAPGSGKSDVALRCMGIGHSPLVSGQAVLVADDQVLLDDRSGRLVASSPAAIRGMIEVRGLGIRNVMAVADAELTLVVDLVARDAVPRLPDPSLSAVVAGNRLPLLRLCAFDASTPLKILMWLQNPPGIDAGGAPFDV